MTCPECERRQKEEKRSLDDCNSSLEAMKVKCHRLTVALSVVSAVAGKEALDMAFSLSDSVAAIIEYEGSPASDVLALDVSVEQESSLLSGQTIPEFEQIDDLFFGVDGNEFTLGVLSQPQISVIEVFEKAQPILMSGVGFFGSSKSLHSNHSLSPSEDQIVVPSPTSLPLLALLAWKGRSRVRKT
tara:strand:+ start:79 stop:636 length:558 start_codon:yes stop_codon:yes gene_type:complete